MSDVDENRNFQQINESLDSIKPPNPKLSFLSSHLTPLTSSFNADSREHKKMAFERGDQGSINVAHELYDMAMKGSQLKI
ncbi:hypothetical protein GCM10011318_15660 [Phaeocystidibacter marisrubri]|nr:hypothetical protein GCM10011318_15660 [Phaeocystidibacter marisrubri]